MMLVTPIVCFILDYSLRPELNHDEVADLFSFPLEGFLTSDPSHPLFHSRFPTTVLEGHKPYHSMEDYPWFDGLPHRFHAFEAKPQPITGLTAEILIHVASIAYGRPPDYPLFAPSELPQPQLIARAIQDPKWHEFRKRWEEKKVGKAEVQKGKL
ncbi:hypothetical protein JCM8547_003278 [Rhodosporidiobolus lusitaniae]